MAAKVVHIFLVSSLCAIFLLFDDMNTKHQFGSLRTPYTVSLKPFRSVYPVDIVDWRFRGG
jgi:hypothetical protein